MNGLACLMFIFAALIFAAGVYLSTGRKGEFTELLIWKNPKAHLMTKKEIKNVGKWTMIVAIVPFLIAVISLIVDASNNKEEDTYLKTGSYVSICEKSDESDGIKVSSVTTTNYDENKYAINMKVEAVYEYETKESYDFYLEETKNTYKTYKKMNEMIFKYESDEKKRTISTILIYKTIHLDDTNKDVYYKDTIVKSCLSENGKCKSIDMTKKTFG